MLQLFIRRNSLNGSVGHACQCPFPKLTPEKKAFLNITLGISLYLINESTMLRNDTGTSKQLDLFRMACQNFCFSLKF